MCYHSAAICTLHLPPPTHACSRMFHRTAEQGTDGTLSRAGVDLLNSSFKFVKKKKTEVEREKMLSKNQLLLWSYRAEGSVWKYVCMYGTDQVWDLKDVPGARLTCRSVQGAGGASYRHECVECSVYSMKWPKLQVLWRLLVELLSKSTRHTLAANCKNVQFSLLHSCNRGCSVILLTWLTWFWRC